jgi:putative ABC transport system substrate-binding protein
VRSISTVTRQIIATCLACVLLLSIHPVEAQEPGKMARIGVLRIGSPPDPLIDSFRDGLNNLGYVEGRNIAFELRYTQGGEDHLRKLATDLVRRNVDVIVAPGGTAARVAKNTTYTIPIVITAVADPVGEGLVASLARPGGNVTGLSNLSPDLAGKRIEALKEAFPKISRLAILVAPSEEGGQMKTIENAAKALKLQTRFFQVNGRSDIDASFDELTKQTQDAILVIGSGVTFEHRKSIAEQLIKLRLPAMMPHVAFVEAGGLMSYGPNFADLYRRAAIYVDKILKGSKPAELPVEQPTKFDFIVNLKTAKAMGLTIPPNLLARSNRVIK